MRIQLPGALAAASALIALAGIASGARADDKPKKEDAKIEQVVVTSGEGELRTRALEFAPRSDAAINKDDRRRFIGVTISNISEAMATHLGVDRNRCLIVEAVEDDGPADKAGLRVHDLIVGINGEDGCSINDLSSAVKSVQENGVVRLHLRRGDNTRVINIKPGVSVVRADEASGEESVAQAFFSRGDAEPGAAWLALGGDKSNSLWYSFGTDSDRDDNTAKATYEIYSRNKQALEALEKLESLLAASKASGDTAAALKKLREALQTSSGQWSPSFNVLPKVEFFSQRLNDAKGEIKATIQPDVKANVKSSVDNAKSMYIPSIELDSLKVVVGEDDDDNFVKAITVGPKDAKTITLHGALTGQLNVAKALHLGDKQLGVDAGELGRVAVGGVGNFAVLKALEDVRATAADCDDESVRGHLSQIEKQLDRIEKLLKRMLDAIE